MNPTQNTRSLWANFFAIAFVIIFCVGWFVRFEWQMLTGDYWYNDDNAQHVAWMWKWKDNQFAENDLMNEVAEQIQPIGYKALAWLAMRVMTPDQFGKYMPLAALLATCFFAFFLVKKRWGIPLGLAAAVLIGFLTIERMVGFNARALGYPLLLAFLYFFEEKKWNAVAICVLTSICIYPVSFLIEVGILSIEAMRWMLSDLNSFRKKLKSIPNETRFLKAVILFSIFFGLNKSRHLSRSSDIGPMFSKLDLLSMPVFGEVGRVSFQNEVAPLEHVFKVAFLDSCFMWPIVAVCFLVFLADVMKNKKMTQLDKAIFYLPAVGIGLFLLGRIILPTLFLPTRYLTYTYPIFFSLLLVRVLGIHADFFKKWWATALLLATLITPRFLTFERRDHAQQDYGHYAWLFKKVNELPPDHGLIAGPPFSCDMLPMHCKRSVLFSYEGFHALYFKKYWEKMAPRLYDYIVATTTQDSAVVQAFVKKYGVSYLIIDRHFVELGREFPTFEPFKSYLLEKMAKNPDRNFAISQFPAELYTKVEKNYWILDCRQWLKQ